MDHHIPIQHSEIVVRKDDTVKSIMASVRALKKQCRRRPYTYTIRAPNMDSIATAVMAAGLLGSDDPSAAANNWHIHNAVHQTVAAGANQSHVDTEVAFSFSGNLLETHEKAQRYIGGREEYEEIESRVKDGRLPSCWYISNLNGNRTLSGSINACITRLQKSQARGESMHMGAAGSATRILYTMAAKAIELETHVISEMTVHNGKRPPVNNESESGVKRDVTFVHIILQPAEPRREEDITAKDGDEDEYEKEELVNSIRALQVGAVGGSP